MIVGFTGTRRGMTQAQREAFAALMREWQPTRFVHGACLGADEEAVEVVRFFVPSCCVVARPCVLPRWVSQRALSLSDLVHEVDQPLRRNRAIVHNSHRMSVCPGGPEEVRSGTWSTVRYARKHDRLIAVAWPDGSVTREGE